MLLLFVTPPPRYTAQMLCFQLSRSFTTAISRFVSLTRWSCEDLFSDSMSGTLGAGERFDTNRLKVIRSTFRPKKDSPESEVSSSTREGVPLRILCAPARSLFLKSCLLTRQGRSQKALARGVDARPCHPEALRENCARPTHLRVHLHPPPQRVRQGLLWPGDRRLELLEGPAEPWQVGLRVGRPRVGASIPLRLTPREPHLLLLLLRSPVARIPQNAAAAFPRELLQTLRHAPTQKRKKETDRERERVSQWAFSDALFFRQFFARSLTCTRSTGFGGTT